MELGGRSGGGLGCHLTEARRSRRAGSTKATRRTRLSTRASRLIDVDLHMHTDHSHDCETPVEVLLAAAKEAGLGAIAVTDHNEISGALEASEEAEPSPGRAGGG